MLVNPIITLRQRQVIRGTILGGSSIVKPKKGRNCYLSMRCKNASWIEFKSRELNNLASFAPFTKEKTFRWHSMCYPVFEEYRKEFYKKKGERFLALESLDPLQDIGLAIWFADCGRVKNDRIILNTHIWQEAGTKVIAEYFSLLGYTADIFMERNCLRVRLDQKSSQSFLRLVTHHLPNLE